MRQKIWLLLVLLPMAAPPQTSQPTIRVRVKSDAALVHGADVMANGHAAKTGPDGVVVLPAALGQVEVRVTKEGFFPTSASLDIDAAREWSLEVELQRQKDQQEQVT